MMINPKIIILFFLIMSIISFLLMGYDKWQACHAGWRVPEKTLWIFTIFGGSLGSWLGMLVFHHKIKKKLFKYGIPLLFICQWGYGLVKLYH